MNRWTVMCLNCSPSSFHPPGRGAIVQDQTSMRYSARKTTSSTQQGRRELAISVSERLLGGPGQSSPRPPAEIPSPEKRVPHASVHRSRRGLNDASAKGDNLETERAHVHQLFVVHSSERPSAWNDTKGLCKESRG
jgi:hypothetical protein